MQTKPATYGTPEHMQLMRHAIALLGVNPADLFDYIIHHQLPGLGRAALTEALESHDANDASADYTAPMQALYAAFRAYLREQRAITSKP